MERSVTVEFVWMQLSDVNLLCEQYEVCTFALKRVKVTIINCLSVMLKPLKGSATERMEDARGSVVLKREYFKACT